MASPSFRINGNAVGTPASVAAAGAVTATLDSTDGVRQVQWSISSTDETTVAANYTLVQSGSVGQTVTCTALTAGTAAILRAKINNGLNIATGLNDPNGTQATGKFYVPTTAGFSVGCVNEIVENDAVFGWCGIINPLLRAAPAGAIVTSVSGTAPIVSSGGATPAISISASSGSVAGSMSAAHFTLVNNATASATASAIIKRDGSSRAQVADPSANADIDTKGARDAAILAAHTSTLLLASGSVAIPSTAKTVRITCQAPGGGGGGGATRGAGVAVGGGGGGGGGGYSQHVYDASRLLAIGSTLTVTIGAAGAGGAGALSPDSDGTAGTSAGDITVAIGATTIIAAGGGDGGGGGTVGAGGAGGGGGDGYNAGSSGATGSIGGAGPSAPSAPSLAGAGGGGGGGISAGDSAGSGGDGGGIPVWRGGTGTGGAGGSVGTVGSIGTDVAAYPLGGGGGGGGGGNAAGNGGAGAAGGISGGGGGGGGAARNGSRAGAGDTGRAGSVLVEIW